MSSGGRSFGHGLLLAATAAGTTWVAMLAWRGFAIEWGRYLSPLLVIAAAVALSGTALRWARISGWLVFLAQTALVALVVWLLLGGSVLHPVASGHHLAHAFDAAVSSAQAYAPPVPPNVASIHPILVVCGAAALLVVDLVACTLRRVPLAGLPLLAVYCVPVSLLGHGVAWVVFLLTAAGYLTLLFLQESEHIARWGRPVGTAGEGARDESGFGLSTGASRASASSVAGIALVLAVVLPLFIPTFDLATWGFGPGDGNGPIKIVNPMTDLRRDLYQGADRDLIRFTTDNPDPAYLRISVLTKFNGVEWTAGDRSVPETQLADGVVPLEQGLASSVDTTSYTYSMHATSDFQSRWLPTAFPAASVQAPGDWRYDVSTMDFLAGSDSTQTTGESWTMVGAQPKLSGFAMSQSLTAPASIQGPYTDLPDTLPPLVGQLAAQVTRGEDSRFEKAVALQRWFRQSGGFRYSLKRAPSGSSEDDLVNFLSDAKGGRVGYCEQFASAFAIMARTLEIPARVAVGFLRPKQVGQREWEYSSHDLHAWPELYFEGSGWVRFEPTPGGRAPSVPAYTVGQVKKPSDPTTSGLKGGNVPSESATSQSPTTQQSHRHDGTTPRAGSSVPWLTIVTVLVGVAVLVALLLLPRSWRRRRRDRRLAGGAEDVWAELHDSVIDLGLPWPSGRSPRESGRQLAHYFGAAPNGARRVRPERGRALAPDAVEALDRIVLELEELRYSRWPEERSGVLRADAERCLRAWQDGSTQTARRRAEWLPRSLFTRRTPGSPVEESGPELVSAGGVVDHAS